MAMKHYFMDDFEEKVPELLKLLAELFEQIDTDTGFLEVFLRCISSNKKCGKEWLKKQADDFGSIQFISQHFNG